MNELTNTNILEGNEQISFTVTVHVNTLCSIDALLCIISSYTLHKFSFLLFCAFVHQKMLLST